MQQNVLFLFGVILGCAARHPAQALQAGCAFLWGVWTALRAALWAAWGVVDGAATRNLALLLGFGVLTEVAVGGGASLVVVLFLAAKLPGSSNTQTLRRERFGERQFRYSGRSIIT